MYVVCGLGNPGEKYFNTKHNIGFEVVDYIARIENLKVNKRKHSSLLGEFRHGQEKIILMKPQTYMNLSGDAVLSVFNYYNMPIENLILVYDDIDIPLGNIRIRKSGSSGTHNGMRDIIYKLKREDFPRIRIGIGSSKNIDLKNYVLSGYSKQEVPIMEQAVENAYKAILTMVECDVDKAMNLYNTKKEKNNDK